MKLYKRSDGKTIFTVEEALAIYKLEGIEMFQIPYDIDSWIRVQQWCHIQWFYISCIMFRSVQSEITNLIPRYDWTYSNMIILPILSGNNIILLDYERSDNVHRRNNNIPSARWFTISIFIP